MSGFHTFMVVAAVAGPLLVLMLRLLPPVRGVGQALTPFAALPLLVLAVVPPAAGEVLALPELFTGLLFRVDAVGRAFLLLTGVLWFAGSVYARGYIGERRGSGAGTFHGYFLLALAGNAGLVLAADPLSFYLFFALMTFSAYALVVHDRTPAALRAGRVYIAMAVAGEGALLSGLLLLGGHLEGSGFGGVPAAYLASGQPLLLGALFAAGFAVKAGLFPLHLWLPLAHPVAPTPASALLSGAMIKAGLLGWIRFLPLGTLELPELGAAFIVAGLASAILAVGLGLVQTEVKTILAYSSVSQMGYMALGIGAALLSVELAGAALLGIAIYAIHHALAKAALFLSVGVLPPAEEPRRRRAALMLVALPALALAGAPLTSGALAKGALKSGVAGLPGTWAAWIDVLLLFAALGTTVLMARFLSVLLATGGHAASGRKALLLGGPWLALLLLSAAGAFWLPHAYRPPAGLDLPGPFYGIGASFWPVALGGALALGVWRFRTRLAYLGRVRVPAGDVLAWIEGALHALNRLAGAPGGRGLAAVRAWGRAVRDAAGDRLALLGTREVEMTAGGTLGVLVVVLAVLLGAAVLLGG
jgi:formate hydrogenlyase subunit 3/multisubunit Na+/H+ antiporter MnhD subunit